MSSPFLDLRGVPILQEEVLGQGCSAVVVLCDGLAVKKPLRYRWSSDADVEVNLEVIRREQDVYHRFQASDVQCAGIVNCLGFSAESTQLAFMPNGDLRTYLEANKPSQDLQLSWFRDMAHTLEYIHNQRVLIADIASRNFLLDSDMTIKFCDFSEASLLPLDADMDTVDDNGYTTRIDIAFLGAVFYEVITGKKCEIDLFQNNLPGDGRASLPERETLPSTDYIWLGPIIESCWDNRGFRNAHDLLSALDSVVSVPPDTKSPFSNLRVLLLAFDPIKNLVRRQSIAPVVVVFGAFSILAVYMNRRRV